MRSIYYDVSQGSLEWHNLRKRITASKLGFLIFSKTHEQKLKSANQILGLEKIEFTKEQIRNMKVGVEFEDTVRQYYCKKNNLNVRQVGFYISKKYPFLGGSPDGILDNGDIIEIKISSKNVPETYSDDFCEIYTPYLYQMMLNCYLTNANNCHFIFYSRESGKLYTRIIPFNKTFFVNTILLPCIEFYNDYLIDLALENNIIF